MAQSEGRSGGVGAQSGGRAGADSATGDGRTMPYLLPADLDRALRHLDDAQLDRLRAAVAADARRRGHPDGKTSEPGTRRRPAPVTPGQERLVLAAFESGLKPAVIAWKFSLSPAQVEAEFAVAKAQRW